MLHTEFEERMPTTLPRPPQPAPRRRHRAWSVVGMVGVVLLSGAAGAGLMKLHERTASVVAAVNGQTITRDAFFGQLQQKDGAAVLQQMVQDEAELQYARKLGVAPTEAQVNAEYDTLSQRPNFSDTLAASRMTPEDYREQVRLRLTQAAIISAGVQVSDDDIQHYYRSQTDPRNPEARFYTQPTADIAIIVTHSKDRCDEAKRHLDQAETFAEVAQKYSQDSSRDDGGRLPTIMRGQTKLSAIPGFDATVFGLGIGRMAGPCQIAHTWWIIKCLDKTPPKTAPFDTVKEECRRGALLTKGMSHDSARTAAGYKTFLHGAKIQALWPQYREVLNIH